MLFGMKHDLKLSLAAVAAAFDTAAGPIPLERLIGRHLQEIADLRARGLTWEQIARLLAGAGIVRADGLAFPAAHLRGVFGRQRKRQTTAKRQGYAQKRRSAGEGDRTAMPDAIADEQTQTANDRHSPNRQPATIAEDPRDRPVEAGTPQTMRRQPANTVAPTEDRAAILALMRQSAGARRSPR